MTRQVAVLLPTQLDSYTDGVREHSLQFDAAEITLDDALRALDSKFPGLRFRVVDEHNQIRRHVAMFVGEQMVRSVTAVLPEQARIQIVGALSGG